MAMGLAMSCLGSIGTLREALDRISRVDAICLILHIGKADNDIWQQVVIWLPQLYFLAQR